MSPAAARGAHLAVIALSLAALFPLQRWLDARQPQLPPLPDTLPPPRVLALLSFGHGETAAELLEIQGITFLMKHLELFPRLDPGHVQRLYDAVTALDPRDPWLYARGATLLSAMADRPRDSLALLERGLAQVPAAHPQRWVLHHELASTYFVSFGLSGDEAERQANVRRAGEHWLLASQLPGAPPLLEEIGRDFLGQGLSRIDQLRREVQIWEARAASPEEMLSREARQRAREARAALNQALLEEELPELRRRAARLAVERGRAPADVRELGVALEDPLEVGYFLHGERVHAPGLEAARRQRALQARFSTWRQQHPERLPDLADLGADERAFAAYLAIRIDDDGVTVTVDRAALDRWLRDE